jgi:hypothetical protein
MPELRGKLKGRARDLLEASKAELDQSLIVVGVAARGARRLATMFPADEAEVFRELADLYELQAALFTNFRNKWFGDGTANGGGG